MEARMAGADSTSFNDALKDYYTDETIRDLVYEENPFFAMITKLESFSGRKYIQPVQYGRAQGRSASSVKAQANKSPNQYDAFEVTMASDFASHAIERFLIKQSRNDRGAFFKAQTREIDQGILKTLASSCAMALFRNGSGARGQISGSPTTTITLLEPEDIVHFEKNQVLTLAALETTGAERTGTMTVTSVDRDAGTFTVNALIAGAANLDFIFIEGDRNAKLSGQLAWFPTTAPALGSDSFFAMDRGNDKTRLAGGRLSVTSVPIHEGLRRGLARLGREGAYPETAWMSHQKYRDLELELENKVIYTTTNVTANVGFTGIKLVGTKKPLTVYPDHNCPDANAFLNTMSTLKLVSMGPVPDIMDDDGITMLREVSSWGYEVRADYFANMVCDAPRDNMVLTLE
jgi:hypothetical protein